LDAPTYAEIAKEEGSKGEDEQSAKSDNESTANVEEEVKGAMSVPDTESQGSEAVVSD
jgi:hypothetical protein